MENEFYYLRNIDNISGYGFRPYERINQDLEEVKVTVRFGPPLDTRGKVTRSLLERGINGLYIRNQDRTLPLRDKYSEGRVTLDEAIIQLQRIFEEGPVKRPPYL